MYIFLIVLVLAIAACITVVLRFIKSNRWTTITGIVKAGFNQGIKIGARTANLDVALARNLTPGLYLSEVVLDREAYQGFLYYGYNMLSDQICLEVHLLNFNQEIYGKLITITIKKFLRPPKKFNTTEELAEQIKKDLTTVV